MRHLKIATYVVIGFHAILSLSLAVAAPDATPGSAAIDAENFVTTIDNPYFPLTPGTTFIYEGQSENIPTRNEMTVTFDTRTILGVECVVVRDVAIEDGEIIEDTLDWFAQDKEGNVWYFGEESKSYEDGELFSMDGSWEAGVAGALPGIIMPAAPAIGDRYYQEYSVGIAEDQAEVLALGETTTVPGGAYTNVVRTKEWSDLAPGIVEHKSYAPGIGMILAVAVEGENERSELISVVISPKGLPATPTS